MQVDDLRCIAVDSPVEAAAGHAVLVLQGLAGAGDMDAVVALVRALAHELGHGEDMPGLEQVRTTPELLAVAGVPPLLRIYGAGWCPREFAFHAEALARLAKEAALAESFAAFKRMVLRRATLEHEALRAFLLCGVAIQLGMLHGIGEELALGSALGILRPVIEGCRVEPGSDADASMRFGREFILGHSSVEGFLFSVQHEIAHNLLDAVRGHRQGEATPAHDAALREMANGLPALLAEACRRRGRPLGAGDGRCVVLGGGVRLVCTHDATPNAAGYRASLSLQNAPIETYVAARYAYVFLKLAGVDPMQAVLAQESTGLFYLGFAGDDALAAALPGHLSRTDVEAVLAAAPQESAQWIDDRLRAGSVGRSVYHVLIELGLSPRAPEYLGPDPEQTMGDHERSRALRLPGAVSMLDERQARLGFVAALRSADSPVLERLLASRADAQALLEACPCAPGDTGSSLHALFDRDGARCAGPVLADIMETLRVLASRKASLDDIDAPSGDTLLARAAGKSLGLVRFLLQLGADADRPGREGRTPLSACALTGPVEAAQALIAAGAALDARDAEGATALQYAARRGDPPFVALLLEQRASVNLADQMGRTALMLACNETVTGQLCRHGADAGLRDNAGQTALHHAARMRLDGSIAVLLAQGADADAASHLGATPLHEAAIAGGEAGLRLLLDAGADVNEETQNGLTPLMLAARGGRLAAVKLLLARGADTGAQTVSGASAVLLCIEAMREGSRDMSFSSRVQDCVQALLDAGADVDAANDWDFTPLHAAASGFDAGIVKLLLAAGAAPSPRDKHGRTPLSMAQAKGHAAMVEALVQAGATQNESP